MKTSAAPAVLYLNRSGFQFFTQTQSLNFEFPPETVVNLEVKKTDLLRDQIRLFIEQNKIISGNFVVVLSADTCLSKDIANENEAQPFLDLVPFENVSSRVYQINKTFKVVATNQEYFENIEAAFEKMGFRALATTPISLLKIDKIEAKALLAKINQIRQFSLTSTIGFAGLDKEQEESLRRNKRALIMMIPLFIMIIVLIVMVVVMDPLGLKKKPIKPVSLATVKKVEVFDDSDQKASASAVSVDKLSVKIQNASGIANLAGDTREIIKSLGFSEIATSNSNVSMQKTVLVYTSKVNASILQSVVDKLKLSTPNLVVTQSASSEADLVLTLGKDYKKLTP